MNPKTLLQQMINMNPNYNQNNIARNAMDMYTKGDTNGLKELCENLCKSKGTTVEEMRQKLNI